MATPAQIAANQANSKKSTGPVTDEGKAKSSRNHLSHGFAASVRFIPAEDPEEFKALLTDLILEHQPVTATQQILVEKMAHHQWITLRANRIQGDILAESATTPTVLHALPLMIRYQTTAERAFHKAHSELLKAQKQSQNCEIGFESQNAPEPVEVALESQKTPAAAPEPSQPAPQQEKSVPPAAPKITSVSDFASTAELTEWVKTASVDDMWAIGI